MPKSLPVVSAKSGLDHYLSAIRRFPILAPREEELCWIFGDGVNQAADFFSDATSIPSRNVTPLTTFGN